jgi:hypothetical protein
LNTSGWNNGCTGDRQFEIRAVTEGSDGLNFNITNNLCYGDKEEARRDIGLLSDDGLCTSEPLRHPKVCAPIDTSGWDNGCSGDNPFEVRTVTKAESGELRYDVTDNVCYSSEREAQDRILEFRRIGICKQPSQ